LLDHERHVVEIDVQILQNGRGDPVTFANETEENVLRPHVFVAQPTRFFARHAQNLSRSLRKVVSVH